MHRPTYGIFISYFAVNDVLVRDSNYILNVDWSLDAKFALIRVINENSVIMDMNSLYDPIYVKEY